MRDSVDAPEGVPWDLFAAAANSHGYASALTHPLYRYPALMSPHLARAVIEAMTEPGDLVLDPFSGGGTTAIEALALGREVICSDLNSLACFVTRAKAWPASLASLRCYERWADSVSDSMLVARFAPLPLVMADGTLYAPRTHAALTHLRDSALSLADPGARRLALLTMLRVGQLCFDCRRHPPSPAFLVKRLRMIAELAIERMGSYSSTCRRHEWPSGLRRCFQVFNDDARALPARLAAALPRKRIALVLTSPPYPGVHMLYHRWQVYGRKETALPYRLLHLQDGRFESHYTFGSRKEPEAQYFPLLHEVLISLKRLLAPSTLVAQVVGFSDPDLYLPLFRRVMHTAGFEEVTPTIDRVVARVVPHRRWYADLSPTQRTAHEFLLVHRLRARCRATRTPR
jgi:hypothetical protein